MAKIVALDIGKIRTGIAETDELQIIASPLETVQTQNLFSFLQQYITNEKVECIVLGDPKNLDGGDSDNSARVREWKYRLEKEFINLKVYLHDERFTSKMAAQSLVKSGMKKKKRQEKGSLDKVSAAIILQEFLQSRQ